MQRPTKFSINIHTYHLHIIMPGIIRHRFGRNNAASAVQSDTSSDLCRFVQKKQWRKALRYLENLDESELHSCELHSLLQINQLKMPLSLVCALIQLKPSVIFEKNAHEHYPLHCALMSQDCSFEIVELLTKAFPEALTEVDDQGQTPLHLACLYGNITPDIINLLCRTSPSALVMEDENEATPMEVCITRDSDTAVSLKSINDESLQMLHEFTGMYIDWQRKSNKYSSLCPFEKADTVRSSGSMFGDESSATR